MRKRSGLGLTAKIEQRISRGLISLLRPITACILVTLGLFAILVNVVLSPILLKQAVQNAERSLDTIDIELSDMQKSARETAAYTLLSESCIPLLNATSPKSITASNTVNGLRQLRLFTNSNSKVDSISIMNRKAGSIFSTQQIPIIYLYAIFFSFATVFCITVSGSALSGAQLRRSSPRPGIWLELFLF